MSKSAIRNRKALPTRWELRNELTMRELAAEAREGIQSWADYLIETGRIYQ